MAGGNSRRAINLVLAPCLLLAAILPAQAKVNLRGAVGQSTGSLPILVLQDSNLNAFVLETRTIMIRSGLILKAETPDVLQGVIAHEIAHIANDHLTRCFENLRNARNTALAGVVLPAIMAQSNPSAPAGIAIGSQSLARQVFAGHTRAEEAEADHSAPRDMGRAEIDPNGMVDVLDIFHGQESLDISRQDPCVLSHPLSCDQVRAMPGDATAYCKGIDGTDAASTDWYAGSRVKLSTYPRNPGWTQRRVKALKVLGASRPREPFSPDMVRDLGIAYSQAGQNGMAPVVTAKRYAMIGRLKDTGIHAKRALGPLPRGSNGWRRAQDIVDVAETQAKRKFR